MGFIVHYIYLVCVCVGVRGGGRIDNERGMLNNVFVCIYLEWISNLCGYNTLGQFFDDPGRR